MQLSERDKRALIPEGKQVYRRRCIGCHGPKGDGKGPVFAGTFTPKEVWDIVHFAQSLRVDAHVQEMRVAGLKKTDVNEARRRIWGSLSNAAAGGEITDAVVAGNYYHVPVKTNVAKVMTAQTQGERSP